MIRGLEGGVWQDIVAIDMADHFSRDQGKDLEKEIQLHPVHRSITHQV